MNKNILSKLFPDKTLSVMHLLLDVKAPPLLRVLTIVVSILSTNVNAQMQSPYYANFVPKSSEPYSFQQFGDLSVNYFTGLPEVSLPLLELKSRDLVLPVSLNYDATGVRLEDISGSTGMKWNLIAGGFIVRELKSLPDEKPTVGYIAVSGATGNFNSIADLPAFVKSHEERTKDTEPDEFFIVLNQQTIKFVLDQYGKANTIPRQNVKIKPTITSGKISQIEVVFANGTRYVFGSDSNAIEERKIETLTTHITFDEHFTSACNLPFIDPALAKYSLDITHNEKVIDFFNSRWFLHRIESSGGDHIEFNYDKIAGVKFASRPNTLRISPVTSRVRVDIPGCPPSGATATTIQAAIIKHSAINPGEAPPIYADVQPFQSNPPGLEFYDPSYGRTAPWSGSTIVNQSLITENIVKPVSITTSTNSTITFSTTQARSDYPSAFSIDAITLKNMDLHVVKHITFNYAMVNASTQNDLFGLSEAVMMSKISGLSSASSFYASAAASYDVSQISDNYLRKYAYEGLKPYNYVRMFLESIQENSVRPIAMYRFGYEDRSGMRRRTSPLVDRYGFSRNTYEQEVLTIATGKTAYMSNGYNPKSGMSEALAGQNSRFGMLRQLIYPTGGFTYWSYLNSSPNFTPSFPKLNIVSDYDRNAHWVSKRIVEYVETDEGEAPIFETFQDHQFDGLTGWYKSRILSSFPQNRYNLTSGVFDTNKKVNVRLYSRNTDDQTVYNGREHYVFVGNQNDPDVFLNENDVKDNQATVFSVPQERDASGALINSFSHAIFPYPNLEDKNHLRGHLVEKTIFDDNDKKVHSVRNYYEINPEGYTPYSLHYFQGGSYVYRSEVDVKWFYGVSRAGVVPHYQYRYAKTPITFDWISLNKSKETIYDQLDPLNKSISRITTYKYDPGTLQIRESSSYVESDETKKITTKYKYPTHEDYLYPRHCQDDLSSCQTGCPYSPYDLQVCYDQCQTQFEACLEETGSPETAAIIQLKKNNEVSIPVETQTWVDSDGNSRLTSSVVYTYQKLSSGTIVRPKEVWGLSRSLLASEYTESNVSSTGAFIIDNGASSKKMRKLHEFDSYDLITGNLLQQTSFDGIVSSYQWLHNSMIEKHTINPGSEQHETSYSHKPLVGLNSTTDANNISNSFVYDQFNRLKVTRDNDNNILERYRYHYASVNEEFDTDFTVSGVLYTGKSVSFSTPNSSVGMGANSYRWEFGDGQESTGSAVSHTYSDPGTYIVYLHATNPERNPVSVQKQITIFPEVEVSICADGPIQFDICTSSSSYYGECTVSNNTPSSPTVLTASIEGGCGSNSYTLNWEYQSTYAFCDEPTSQWSSFGSGSSVNAPLGFRDRYVGQCGYAGYDVRVTVTDQCGRAVASSVISLEVIKMTC